MASPIRFACVLGLLGLLSSSTLISLRADDPYGDNPQLGGSTGRLRSRIARSSGEYVETPDVVTLKGGVQREAYFLNVLGDRFVYYVKETETSWLREEVARSEVESVEFQQYLPESPAAPRKIEPAKKQPVAKDDVLSGVFTAAQGRTITWTASFQSELDKLARFSEDATDYGAVELRSRFVQRVTQDLPDEILPRGGTRSGTSPVVAWPSKGITRSHEVRAEGKYFLYAPGTVRNEEWVLVLSNVIQTEVDHGRDTSFQTDWIPDETFILYFTPERRSFRLAWSNVGNWTWASLTGISFERLPDAIDARPFGDAPALPAKPGSPPRGGWGTRPILANAAIEPAASRVKLAGSGEWRRPPSKIQGWSRPQSRFGSGR